MQSIEHALGNVEQDILDRVAEDWVSNQQGGARAKQEAARGHATAGQ